MPNFTPRRILLIVGFLFLCTLLAVLLYVMFFKRRPAPVTPATSGTPTSSSGLPTAGTGQPTVVPSTGQGALPITQNDQTENQLATRTLVSEPTRFSTTDANGGGIVFYQSTTGIFSHADASGNLQKLSDAKFPSIQNVTWAPDRSQAVLEFPDGANVLYNFQTKKQVTLPQHWQDFSFSNNGSELAFKSMGLDVNNRWLGVANPDGSGATAVEPLGNNANNVMVTWSPSGQIVGLQHVPSGADQQDIFFVGLHGENFRSLTVPGIGFIPKWTPDGQQLLYSVTSARSDYRPELWVTNASGEQIGTGRRSLDIRTWANKCTFASTSELYCAVPESLPDGAGLTPAIAAATPDVIYKIDITTGQKTLVGLPDSSVTARSLSVSKDGSQLFVEDNQTGNIITVAL
ncbi:hypothetical protein COV04_00095 [Candidatus Uhrbacteria bacterium CG10_big_fil_rev_8_21_14_0_10_48_11]|uniref:Dipeptidylpeptidase IV N-terminal domain-containing protein n=1 Tax=Candidatus Uhrbacteria bacterium CG10_big_fil_rev_8_21_14_0_10_48_11 TaxID=1975037 RepID=A0A2M8LFP2_9BACT|nr:MAG: hypothetical protein COV04_00095 [Candidatus Uhrbacteria bacterium CG10_big_fil_rev_8_21_14_0_10_48_11]